MLCFYNFSSHAMKTILFNPKEIRPLLGFCFGVSGLGNSSDLKFSGFTLYGHTNACHSVVEGKEQRWKKGRGAGESWWGYFFLNSPCQLVSPLKYRQGQFRSLTLTNKTRVFFLVFTKWKLVLNISSSSCSIKSDALLQFHFTQLLKNSSKQEC